MDGCLLISVVASIYVSVTMCAGHTYASPITNRRYEQHTHLTTPSQPPFVPLSAKGNIENPVTVTESRDEGGGSPSWYEYENWFYPSDKNASVFCRDIAENCSRLTETYANHHHTVDDIRWYCFHVCTEEKDMVRGNLTIEEVLLVLMIGVGLPTSLTIMLTMGLIHLIADRVIRRGRWRQRARRRNTNRYTNLMRV